MSKFYKKLLPLFDQSFVSLSTFLATLTVARYCIPAELGKFSVVMSILFFIGIVQGSLITRPMNVLSNILKYSEKIEYMFSLHKFQYVVITIVIFLTFLSLLYFKKNMDNVTISFIISTCFMFSSFQLREFFRFINISSLNFIKATKISGIYIVSLILLLVFFILLERGKYINSTTIITAIGFSSAIPILYSLNFRKNYLSKILISNIKNSLIKNFSFAKWEFIGSISNYGYIGIIPIILASQNKLEEAGGYSAARALLGPIQIVIFSAYNFMVPKATYLFKRSSSKSKNFIIKSIFILCTITSICLLPASIFSKTLIIKVFGASYKEYSTLIPILSSYYLIFCISATLHALVLSRSLPFIKGISQFLGFSVSLLYILINFNSFTAKHGAMATLVGELIVMISSMIFIIVTKPFFYKTEINNYVKLY